MEYPVICSRYPQMQGTSLFHFKLVNSHERQEKPIYVQFSIGLRFWIERGGRRTERSTGIVVMINYVSSTCEQHVKNCDFRMYLFEILTYMIANKCIKFKFLISEQKLREMALVKSAARNGTVCCHHDSRGNLVLLCLFLLQSPTLYSSPKLSRVEYFRKYFRCLI